MSLSLTQDTHSKSKSATVNKNNEQVPLFCGSKKERFLFYAWHMLLGIKVN